MSDEPVRPEHAKLYDVRFESAVQGEFVEWALGKGYLAWGDQGSSDLEQLLAEYHDIDLVKLEAEKREFLRQYREANGEPT